jgi:maltokinase
VNDAHPHGPLRTFIQTARWFGGKGRTWTLGEVRRVGEVPGGHDGLRVAIDLAEVRYEDGSEYYQLPLAYYAERQERLDHALVGEWTDAEFGAAHVYDAVHDREAMALWLAAFATVDPDSSGAVGELMFHRLTGHDLDLSTHSTLFSGEQSNSSVAFGEDALMKVFRRVTPGVNPDIAIHEVLTRAGSDHVAHLYGWLDVVDEEADTTIQLAMLQQFLRTASDGWDLALTSVRNLFAEADLHAEEVGGDFAGEAARLGAALAETHSSLAQLFPTTVLSSDEVATLAAAMRQRLEAALDVVPGLAGHAEALGATYDRLGRLEQAPVQTVHGDLHLGQTLRTVRGWKIVDFEGEPAKPLHQRVQPDSPWRDVAGMLRSFDYAPQVVAHTSFPEGEMGDEHAAEQRDYRAGEWSQRNQEAFLAAYAGRDLTDDEQVLLAAHVADKAVYEAVYEARNRPGWVAIPLRALARMEER